MTVSDALATLDYGPAPEAAAPAMDWLDRHDRRFGLFIGGAWRKGRSHFDTVNPATGEPLAAITQASAGDVDAAVRAAREAFPAWSRASGHVRARYLYALARAVQKHSRLLAVLETLDNGKPIRESRDLDVPLVVRHFYHHAGWAQLMKEELPGYAPLGVAGQIIPWNFPLLMLAWKVAPALAMGNTVVLKPAEFTSLTALLFAELCEGVGLPPGVFNLVTGDGETGAALVAHDGVDKIAFTGSTDVGRMIRRQTAGSGKKLSLELGGKSPFLVFDDADLDSAVEGVVDAIWFNGGQVCCAGSRLLVQEGVADHMLKKLRARMETLRVGDPLDKGVDIGAIVAPVQLQKIRRLVQQGVDEGATLWQPSWDVPEAGCFFPPTLLWDVAPASTAAQEEIFGPVVAATTFRTPDEAVALANNTRYGLAACVWSESVNLALDVATQIKAGTVWINATNLFDAASGFGGCRESGFGREGGREGLWEYVERGAGTGERGNGREGERERGSEGERKGTRVSGNGHADGVPNGLPAIDRTAKLFIGGKQVRPDGGYSLAVRSPDGRLVGAVGAGNRKDVRNAVEAARKAADGWARTTGHARAQILFYLGENLAARAGEFAARLAAQTGQSDGEARAEAEATVEALFSAAAWADKYDGAVHQTPFRNVTLAVPEGLGVLAVVCPDDHPLLALAALAAHALAMGNAVVVVPSPVAPLAATDFYQVLETSDVPAGTFNVVTGERDALAKTLAEHDDVDGLWFAGGADGRRMVERAAAGNMKRTWGLPASGSLPPAADVLRRATQIKNIWVPYGA